MQTGSGDGLAVHDARTHNGSDGRVADEDGIATSTRAGRAGDPDGPEHVRPIQTVRAAVAV